MKKYSTSVSKLIKRRDINDTLNITSDDIEVKKRLLEYFGFDTKTIDFDKAEITLKISNAEDFVKLNPTITKSYYNEDDILTQTVKKAPCNNDLLSFEGKIYEELHFNSDEEALSFAKEQGLDIPLFSDTTALIYFKGLEWNQKEIDTVNTIRDLTIQANNGFISKYEAILKNSFRKAIEAKEMYVIKTKNMYTVYYNQPLQYISKKGKTGFTEEEISSIATLAEHFDGSYFVLYVRDALAILNSNLINRGYNPKEKFIDDNSMETYIDCLTSSIANPNEPIFVKLKVVSDTPVMVDDTSTMKLDIDEEVNRKYYITRY